MYGVSPLGSTSMGSSQKTDVQLSQEFSSHNKHYTQDNFKSEHNVLKTVVDQVLRCLSNECFDEISFRRNVRSSFN